MTLPRNFLEKMSAFIEPDVVQLHAESERSTDSPIEATLLTALTFVLRYYKQGYFIAPRGGADRAGDESVKFVIRPQTQIDAYRVDFLVTANPPETSVRVVVECDGHNFHERTKEQAARDRSRDRDLQAQGYRVLRFTGSEIYRDAFHCAGEIIEALLNGRREMAK